MNDLKDVTDDELYKECGDFIKWEKGSRHIKTMEAKGRNSVDLANKQKMATQTREVATQRTMRIITYKMVVYLIQGLQ